jgi:hypothetical protein
MKAPIIPVINPIVEYRIGAANINPTLIPSITPDDGAPSALGANPAVAANNSMNGMNINVPIAYIMANIFPSCSGAILVRRFFVPVLLFICFVFLCILRERLLLFFDFKYRCSRQLTGIVRNARAFTVRLANKGLTKQAQRQRRNGAAAAQAAGVTARSCSLQRMVRPPVHVSQ